MSLFFDSQNDSRVGGFEQCYVLTHFFAFCLSGPDSSFGWSWWPLPPVWRGPWGDCHVCDRCLFPVWSCGHGAPSEGGMISVCQVLIQVLYFTCMCVCVFFFFSETDGRCASPLGPGHPAGELYFQQEIVGLPGWGLQCSKCCRCSVQQPLPCAGHCQCSGTGHSVPQPANPAGTDVASHAGYSTLNGFYTLHSDTVSLSDSQLLVTDVMSQPLALANVLVESAYAVSSKSVILSQAPFTLNEYVSLDRCLKGVPTLFIYPSITCEVFCWQHFWMSRPTSWFW